MVGEDERIRQQLRAAAHSLGERGVSAVCEEGHVILDGVVSTDERSYELEAIARRISGVQSVTNDLMVERFDAAVDNVVEGIDLTPDFNADVGTGDASEAVSEAEPYFPPTDPVVKSDRSRDGIEMLGGFAEGADVEGALANLPGPPRGDDEVRDAVLAALHLNSETTDLTVQVEVENAVVTLSGVVPSLEDVDLVESVAAGIPGVEEVREELQIEGM